jgi:hypothetical protein
MDPMKDTFITPEAGGPPGFEDMQLRRGKWTPEEERYCNKIIVSCLVVARSRARVCVVCECVAVSFLLSPSVT